MKAKIIQIGNSQGIRIPKTVLDQCDLKNEVEIEIIENGIVIRSHRHARQGWAQAFKKMAQNNDDKLLDGDLLGVSSWDKAEWEW